MIRIPGVLLAAGLTCSMLLLSCAGNPAPAPPEPAAVPPATTQPAPAPSEAPAQAAEAPPAPPEAQAAPAAAAPPATEPAPPSVEASPPPSEPSPPAETAPQAPAFDPASVTAEEKATTLQEAKLLILSLNRLIQRKDYEAWLGYLTEEYVRTFSDPDFLAKTSESTFVKRQGVRLANLKDYFLYVVYPNHQEDKVDDIVFVGTRRIIAYTISPRGERLILYNLEKINDSWKIGIGR